MKKAPNMSAENRFQWEKNSGIMSEAEITALFGKLEEYMVFASEMLNNYGYFVSYNVDMGRVEIHEQSVFSGVDFIDGIELDISEAGVYAAKCFIAGFKSGINSMADRR